MEQNIEVTKRQDVNIGYNDFDNTNAMDAFDWKGEIYVKFVLEGIVNELRVP